MTANARQHLADAPSLNLQRLQGGWIILLPDAPVPLACRVPAEVLAHVQKFLACSLRLDWELTDAECSPGSCLFISKLDGGYLVSIPSGPAPNGCGVHATPQYVEFEPLGVLRIVGHWLGLGLRVEASSDDPVDEPPPNLLG